MEIPGMNQRNKEVNRDGLQCKNLTELCRLVNFGSMVTIWVFSQFRKKLRKRTYILLIIL